MGLRDRYRYNTKNTFFITTTCYKWLPLISIGNGFGIVSDSLNFCCKKYSANMLAYVLMPNHIHMILHFTDALKRSDFMRDFKKYTSTMIRKQVEKHSPELLPKMMVNSKKQIFKVWQDRFDEVYLESRSVTEVKLDYIHNNPLQERWQLTDKPEEYVHSSASYYELEKQPLIKVSHYLEFI